MKRIENTIEIHAPVTKVFEFAHDPNNLPGVWPSMVACTNIVRTPTNLEFDYTYKMAGIQFTGHAASVVFRPNEYVEVKTTGGLPSTFRYRYAEKAGITTLNVEIEYTIPLPVLGKLAEAAVHKINEKELETMLFNTKSAVEIPAPALKEPRSEKRR